MAEYDWEGAANSEGPVQAPKVPAGQTELTVCKIVFGKGTAPFVTSKGDPYILVVFNDAQGRECAANFTLSDAAGWVLAKMLSASGANMQRMKAAGVTPQNFADEAFATKQLMGRKFLAQVDYDAKGYAVVTPIKKEAAAALSPPMTDAETIPF